MKKKIFGFLLSLFLLVANSLVHTSVNAQTTLEYDIDPEKSGRVFDDRSIGGVRYIGCAGTGGDCGATITINDRKQ